MIIHSQNERECVCLSQTVRVRSRENTWIKLEEDRGRVCYSVLRPQDGVGTARKSETTPCRRGVTARSFGVGTLQPKGGWEKGMPHSLSPWCCSHMSPGKCRNSKSLSGCSPAQAGSEMSLGLCGVGAGQAVEKQSSFHRPRK